MNINEQLFQSLVRDGSCFNCIAADEKQLEMRFQSLVRDGSCFNPSHHQPHSGHTHKCICEQAYLYHRHWDDATRLPFINRVWYQHF